MSKPLTAETKKASTAKDKVKKKRNTKIVKGGKLKTKKSNDATSTLMESTIPSNIAVSRNESWSLTQSIREFVRMEVEDALMKTSNKRQSAHEASAKEKVGHNDGYVKMEDLNDIVNKLISQHMESVIKRNLGQIQETADKVLTLEETLKSLTVRMKTVEESVSEMRKGFLPTSQDSQRVQRVTGVSKPKIRFQLPDEEPLNEKTFNKDLPFVSSSMPRLGGGSQTRLPSGGSFQPKAFSSKSSDDSDDDSSDLESNASSTVINNDHSRSFDEILKKCCLKTGGKQTDLASTRSPSELDVTSSMASLEEDWEKRMAERRQIETNMLRYKKSPITLQVESHKNYFPNEKPNTPPANTAPLTRRPPPRPVHPRLSRPGITNTGTAEAQSDWLFEQ